MEKRLKKERNKLFLRVILIILAVWLTVSTVFFFVRLNIERINTQNREIENLSYKIYVLSRSSSDYDILSLAMNQNNDFLNNDGTNNYNTHMIVIDTRLNSLVADTAKAIMVNFGVKGEDYSPEFMGLIGYDSFRKSLSDTQYKRIKKLFSKKREDGNYYELVCTKFHFSEADIYPLELKVVLVDSKDKRFLINDNVETFKLKDNFTKDDEVYKCNEVRRNRIPESFFLKKEYNKDLISSFSRKQQKELVCIKNKNLFECVAYANDYVSYNAYKYDYQADPRNESWYIQYAKEVNLLDYCKSDLVLGLSIIFVLFLIISFLLCLMIWRTIKMQIIQEQKRTELTNALAHDIKTPLFVISGYAYSLKENIDDNERDSYIGKILEQTEDINGMVHKMLDLSKLDSYSVKLNRVEFDLYELVKSVVDKYVMLPDGKSFSITRNGKNNVFADKELIKTAVENLVDNALKYSPKNSVIEITVNNDSFMIKNPCENLTKSDLKDISKAYVRKDKSRHQKGNGLGLSIVESILNLHNAKSSIKLENDNYVFSVSL